MNSRLHQRIGLVSVAAVALAVVPIGVNPAAAVAPGDATVFVSELHYDNDGTDVGEAIEVFGPAATDLTGWTIELYNGSNGTSYDTVALTGTIPDEGAGFGTVAVSLPVNGLQNGGPDGLALVDATTAVVQFLSYEGSFAAVGGPADGLTSTDIGVAEAGDTAVGQSLQLVGDGVTYGELTWTGPAPSSFGSINDAGPPPPVPADVFVSELHYDNAGDDVGEAVEVFGPAGTDLAGWTIALYNGNGGGTYGTIALSGVLADQAGGFGTLAFDGPASGIQNGAPDGLALVAPDASVAEFLSYEGVIVATDGPATGLTSTDIGVSQQPAPDAGLSLQRVGAGTTAADLTWEGPRPASFGAINEFTPPPCAVAPAITPIHVVQGAGVATPCADLSVTIEGVVVADYEGPSPTLRGFYVQEEDADADVDPATSEGIFVFHGSEDTVAEGDLVRVTGVATEFQGQTQLDFPSALEVLAAAAPLPTPATVTFPLASDTALEAVEGMLVTVPQTLYVTEFFQLGRFGQVVVSSGERLDQPTAVAEPGSDANAVQAANDLNRLIIDDELNNQNPDPIIYGGNGGELTAANPLRGGDTVTGATGVMTYTWAGNSASGNAYRLRPAVAPIEFSTANPRPTEVPDVGGSLHVASFNVLNYFVSLDQSGTLCGPTGFQDECRGAQTAEELERQRAKLLAALVEIDADVLGLVELENTTGVEPLADIVAGLNAILGEGTYDYIETGTIGTDVIKVGVIYQPAAVTPRGVHAILDSSVDARFDDGRNRPALAQSFQDNASGEVVTVVVNHLKSKGCGGETGLDVDQGDGQGCFNETRRLAAEAMVDWLATSPTGIADSDHLILGDLNSYAKEDPIDVLVGAGYVDLGAAFDPEPYSYVFDGQWGYLDYALASPSLVAQVTGAAEYHINADEVPVLDYNTDFKSPEQIVELYAPDQFRTSDHDPVLVGLSLDAVDQVSVALPPILLGGNHKLHHVSVFSIGERFRLLPVEIVGGSSSEADSGLGHGDVAGDIELLGGNRARLRAESFDRHGRTYTLDVMVTDGTQVEFDTVDVYVLPRFGRRW